MMATSSPSDIANTVVLYLVLPVCVMIVCITLAGILYFVTNFVGMSIYKMETGRRNRTNAERQDGPTVIDTDDIGRNLKIDAIKRFDYLHDCKATVKSDARFARAHEMGISEFAEGLFETLGDHAEQIADIDIAFRNTGDHPSDTTSEATASIMRPQRMPSPKTLKFSFKREFIKSVSTTVGASTDGIRSIKIHFLPPDCHKPIALRNEEEWQQAHNCALDAGLAWKESALSEKAPFSLFIGSDYISLNRYEMQCPERKNQEARRI